MSEYDIIPITYECNNEVITATIVETIMTFLVYNYLYESICIHILF